MNGDSENTEIEVLINSFFTEMNVWEKFCYAVDNEQGLSVNERNFKQVSRASEIVEKFLTKKERKWGLPNNISYGHEGSYNYNPEEEKIVSIEVKGNTATVTTAREKPISETNKYIVKRIKGDWLIDSKKRYSWREKWEMAYL